MALILVIDDSEICRALVRRMLERERYRVIDAADGDAGIECFAREAPDLVITDIIMPNREGIETIREIRRMRPNARIIAMSGSVGSGSLYLEAAKRLGADEVLVKPFPHTLLTSTVHRLLDRAA